MHLGLVRKGAAISIAGGILALVGTVFIALDALRVYSQGVTIVPVWVYTLIPIFTNGLAIFALGAALALWGLASSVEE